MPYLSYPQIPDPYSSKNPFRELTQEPTGQQSFAEIRGLLPAPILPGQPIWERMYWQAWEMLWDHIQQPPQESRLLSSFSGPLNSGNLDQWATAFVSQIGVYARRIFPFIKFLDNFYACQHDDGFICRFIDPQGQDGFYRHDPNSTGPNILAWTEWRNYRASGNDSHLKEAFWPLLAYHRWLDKNRTWPNGMYWTTGLASGMSNQTRITGKVEESMYHHCHWTWVDANMQAALDTWVLSQVAVLLEEKSLAEGLAQEHHQLVEEINGRLWNEKGGFYQDVGPNGKFSEVKSIGAYWGLLGQVVDSKERLNSFVKHLYEAESFKRPHQVPSQSADSPGYDPDSGAYWRGGVWSPTNYMLLKGLRNNGRHKLAFEIAMNHLENVGRIFERTGTFWENYEAESAAPGQPAAQDYVGWTGLSPISILLEDVIGISVDWPQRRVTWDRRYQSEAFYGVRNYPVGEEGVMDLIGDNVTVTVSTTVPLTLVIQNDELNIQTAVPAGSTEIDLE